MAKRKSDAEKKKIKKEAVAEVTKSLIARAEKSVHPGGRPTLYSPEICELIYDKISTSVQGLRRLCFENPDMPAVPTIMRWLKEKPEFKEQYEDAKRMQATLFVEEIIDIAYDNSMDYIETEDGGERLNSEFVARSRLKIDSIKWIACKLLPKVYGDKIQNETNVRFSHEEAVEALG